jgi:chromosome segregation ATPase
LSTQLIDKEQLLGTLKGKCETQQKSIDESNRKRQSMIKTHQEQVEAKDQQISEALRSNEVLQWKHKTDLEDLQAKTSIGAHKKNIRDIEKLLRAAEADVRKATEEFKSKELQLAEAQATIQSLQSSLDTANTDLQVKQRKLATESARFEALQTSRDALSADLEAKKKEIDASKAEIEKFRDMDQDANGTIDGLRIQIQRLTEERDILASDLKQAEDNLDAHKRLDSQTLERRNRVLTGGVKRERDELQNDGESDRALKRTRIVPVITIKQEGAIDLTGDDDNVPAQSLNV